MTDNRGEYKEGKFQCCFNFNDDSVLGISDTTNQNFLIFCMDHFHEER